MPLTDRIGTLLSIQFRQNLKQTFKLDTIYLINGYVIELFWFSSYSPNGLLYFRGSQKTGDFLALELSEGSIALKSRCF